MQTVTLYKLTASCILIRRVQVNQDGLKLNGTHQLLVYADDVSILVASERSYYRENMEGFLVAAKEIGLEVKTDISSIERVEQFI